MQDSSNLRSIRRDISLSCGCVRQRTLSVTVYSFDEITTVIVCSCSAGKQLLLRGYFPSAPLRPTVAFDIKMLEFARELYLRSPPNRSAWAATLETYLRGRGYIITGVEKTRRKFAKASRYYALLVAETDVHGVPCPMLPVVLWSIAEHDDLTPADVVVCVDACFMHKRRKPARGSDTRDPPFRHPRTTFITEAELLAAKRLVESARPPRAATTTTDATADSIEKGMKLPESVLNGCSDSFKAADETHVKASTGFFTDTGVMAVLCRHDRPVYLANVRTPGEQQFHVVALIIKLFENIPSHWTVGLLYDIGCQLHRSCLKWNFIPDYIERIIWGISVFHAYGHQWPCQLVYHPRKCDGFGLSDGEGCERFWSSIQGLIPSGRMSGYHQRILTLDFQIWFLHEEGLPQLAPWLLRKWNTCVARKQSAKAVLDDCDYSVEELGSFWDDQVHTQTRPLVAATAGLAKASIKAVMKLITYQGLVASEIAGLDNLVTRGEMDAEDAVDRRKKLTKTLETTTLQIRRKKAQLGVSDKADLKRLQDNKYLKLRMQARAKKERIQTKLRHRRFELERANRVYSRMSASERRLNERIESKATSRGSSIGQQVSSFNQLCNEIRSLIQKRHAPHHAVAPLPLDRNSIYSLDVDDPIWNDRGLDDEDEPTPLWLGHDEVREGIKALLLWRRCEEEERYLTREVVFLQTWYRQEWVRLNHAISRSTGAFLSYLEWKRNRMLHIGARWSTLLDGTSLSAELDDWGPSSEDFSLATQDHRRDSVYTKPPSSSDSSSTASTSDLEDNILLGLGGLNLTDSDQSLLPSGGSDDSDSGSEAHPPAKRKRLS
ncbi:hypothetical protein NMY22_g19449 [Coprinellus aureogranulatus]|nr:hypothetical protein NMY22_g19449 [Coprinellus aureogranulatus]